MTNTIFTGCSYTEGIGLKNTKQCPDLWVNLLHSKVDILKNTNLINLGKSSSNNSEIFKTTIDALSRYSCQYLFVQWTELLRVRVNPSVESYTTSILFNGRKWDHDVSVNPNVVYKKKYIENIKNRFFDLQHSHYDIVKILEYSKIIKQLCDRFGVTVFFINGILPWDSMYFNHITHNSRLQSDTTKYTQLQLNATTRSDEEYFILYDKIHSEYIDLTETYSQWLNLDAGFRACFYLDCGDDDLHPGKLSNYSFAEHLIEKLKQVRLK
jgi:hypothetical protein